MSHEKHDHHSEKNDSKDHHDEHHDEHNEHDHHDHHDHHAQMVEDFKRRFWVCLVLTLPVLLLSPMIQSWLGVNWSFTGDRYVLFGLSCILYFYGGWPFLKGLKDELADRSPGMMTLIAIAISTAFLYSSAVVFGLEGKTFFWELATLIDVMLVGHWIEMRSVMGAGKSLKALAELMPNEANRITEDGTQKVKITELQKGDVVLIKPGEKIPADGTITEGSADINESLVTGESEPVHKSEGEDVIAGSVNGNSSLKVQVNATGEDSYLNKVVKMVKEAQQGKSKTQKLADKAAFWLTIIALTMGTATFVVWLVIGKELAFALERMVTVMVICCPHALGLAIPLVAAISTSHSAKNGLLIRNRTAFENSRNITAIVFDKTGTLTEGSHQVQRIVPLQDELDETELLRLASAVEQPSEHHISKGLMKRAKEVEIEIPEVEDFEYEPGVGVRGKVEGSLIIVGGAGMLKKEGLEPPKEQDLNKAETELYVIRDQKILGYITFADQIRSSSKKAIETLKENSIECLLLTGDKTSVAEHVANELGLERYFAEVLPDQKQDKIKELQEEGEIVAMTGDGVNDAPALAQADIGIAVGSGTDVAAETADIVLVNSDPQDIVKMILFGKETHKKMIQNLWWATGYNVIAMPLATGFVSGLMISPAVGAALMSLSTVICAVNAQLLKNKLTS